MDNVQNSTKLDATRIKALTYFGICILSVFVYYFFAKNFMTKNFLKDKTEFDTYGFDIAHMNYIFYFLIGPILYSGWITLSKILGLLRSNTQWFLSPALWIIFIILKIGIAFMLGFFMLPILVIYHLIQLIFAPKLGFLNNFKSVDSI